MKEARIKIIKADELREFLSEMAGEILDGAGGADNERGERGGECEKCECGDKPCGAAGFGGGESGANSNLSAGSAANAADVINAPAHYRLESGREAIDVIRETLGAAGFVAYCKGNAIKYIARAGAKDGASVQTDLQKAAKYLEFWQLAVKGGDNDKETI